MLSLTNEEAGKSGGITLGSVNNKPVAYINVEERKLEWAAPVEWGTPTIARMDKVPLYTRQPKYMSDDELLDYVESFSQQSGNVYEFHYDNVIEMIRAILDEAQSD
jgi:hypothetical protein